jgi:hypothetical protein
VIRRVIFLNLALAALAGWLGWTAWKSWKAGVAVRASVAKQQVKPPVIYPPAVPEAAKPLEAAEYIDVSAHMLYAKDRNSNVVVEPPPPPPPPPPIPTMPVYLGQLNLVEPVIYFSNEKTPRKGYRVGESVGALKILAFDRDTVTFEWLDKPVERRIADLKPKEDQVAQAQVQAAAPAPTTPTVQNLGLAPANNEPSKPQLGAVFGEGRACVPGDNSAAGTVLDGFRKVISKSPMGQTCYWEAVK